MSPWFQALGSTAALRRRNIILLLLLTPITLLVYTSLELRTLQRFSQTVVVPSPAAVLASTPAPSAVHPSIKSTPSNATHILLVSAFYPLAKSKHTTHEYKQWLKHFLGKITTDLYFFTSSEWEPIVREFRGHLPIHINTTYFTPWDVPPVHTRRATYERMHAKDREAHRHSPELYAVWASKPFFLKEGLQNAHTANARADAGGQEQMQRNKEYNYAFWIDAGTFRRRHVWGNWPDPARVDKIWAEGVRESRIKAEELIFFPIEGLPHESMKLWREGMGPIDNSISEGSFFGGMPNAVDWWYNLYFAYVDHWDAFFVGKDQTLINGLFLLYPSRIISVWLSDPIAPAAASLLASSFSSHDVYHLPPKTQLESPLGQCLDYWYYYVFFLGSELERHAMAELWLGMWRWMWPWQWVGQVTSPKEPCRLTRVLPMETTLQRVFGKDWRPPTASLNI